MLTSQLVQVRVAAFVSRLSPSVQTRQRFAAFYQALLNALPTALATRLRRLRKESVMLYALMFVAIVFEVAGDLVFRKWGIEQRWPLLVAGLAIYGVGAVAWAFSLRYTQVSTGIVLLGVMNVVLVVIGGMVFFKEKLSTTQLLGVLLGVASLALLNADG
jgi:multidrug transporter EmrE-like cation transporter